jgi:hypothetical protein
MSGGYIRGDLQPSFSRNPNGLAVVSMDKKQKTGMRGRAIASLFMFFSFILMIPSGILLHVFARGPFDTRLHILMTIHDVCSIIFVVSGTAHLILNRKSVLSYMRSKTAEYRTFSRELILVALIFAALLTVALLHIHLVR